MASSNRRGRIIRPFAVNPDNIHQLWTPRQVARAEIDAYPRCVRCSSRTKSSVAIEAYEIVDAGDNRVEVMGKCRGTCDDPEGEPTEHPRTADGDNWHDVVRITWDKLTDSRTGEMLKRDLLKQISAIRFFEPVREEAA